MSKFNLPMYPSFMPRFMSGCRFLAWSRAAALLSCLLYSLATAAPLAIEIIGGGANQIPITVLPFAGEDRFAQRMSQIVSADLQRSGLFKLGSIGSVRPIPAEPSEINYRYWKNEGTETMVIGSVSEKTDGQAEVRFRLMDVAKQSQILLYMRTTDGTLRFRRNWYGRMVSTLDTGATPTASIPEATELAHRVGDKLDGLPVSLITETLFNIPTTAHILGGCCMGAAAADGVIDHEHRVHGYDGLYVMDGSSVSANPGVNPSLTIVAMTERAVAKIPAVQRAVSAMPSRPAITAS